MEVLAIGFMLICASSASKLLSIDETETLFKKFVLKELNEQETVTLQELFELLRLPRYVPMTRKQKMGYPTTRAAFARNLECIACRSIFAALFEGVAAGQSDDQLVDTLTTLCTAMGIQTQKVCSGAIELNLPIINYIIRNTPEATPWTFCGLLLQTDLADECPHGDTRFEWQVELPAVPESVVTPTLDPRPLKIAIVTDAHIDPMYEPYGVADCDEPTCCRYGQNPAPLYRLQRAVDDELYERTVVEQNGVTALNLSVASEMIRQRGLYLTTVAKQTPEPAGYWGDYRSCDTPLWAYDDVIDRIAETHNDIDIVYYIGDTIDHGVWETSFELINDMNRHLIEKMRTAFGENVLVVPTIGNHEAQPTNQFAPNRVVGELNTTWLYEALVDKWGPYLTDEAKASLLERGEFSVRPRPGFKVITLNNNIAYRDNWWLVYDPTDAKRHLDWLVEELRQSELAGEKVHILAHIPPGRADFTHTWSREYSRIINRFSSIIAGEFNGHMHSDQFKLFYSSTDGAPIAVAWGGGGATAYSNYNLNYKIMDFDTTTFEATSMECYTYNVTEANLTPNRRPHWFLLYDFKNSFDLPNLSPISIDNLVNAMASEGYYLDLYAAYYSKLSDTRWPYCNQNCKIGYLCDIVITELWNRQKCEELTQRYMNRLQ
ncbi:sphingomyelin phosphodiesterase-like [Plodia interpunctella]|uniref:sphingomyelin phosphodiesterase-like n=1 Tax=Plodia interpunctella TaxID=58824 RepID=UPI0023674F27|nr:sphingomyelin phosphodiesterase-like [Plodia interpunctella]